MALSFISNFLYIHSERETATTALMEGGGPRGPGRGGPSGNGFFNNNCNNLAAAAHVAAHNGGDRSRLFRKSNGSKPVREWYVWMAERIIQRKQENSHSWAICIEENISGRWKFVKLQ